MIHKLLAGKGRMKRAVSLLLCLALLGSSVISTNVTAAEADVTVVAESVVTAETVETEAAIGEIASSEEQAAAVAEAEEERVSEEISADPSDTAEEEATAVDSKIQEAEENAEEIPAEEVTETETEGIEAEEATETTDAEAVSTVEEIVSSTQAANVSMYFEQSVSGVTVTAVAEAGAFAMGTEMSVVLLEADGDTADQYNEAADALDESGVSYDGFVAVDISFTLNGVEVEPVEGHSVSVSLSMESELLDEDVDASSLEVHHIDESGDTVSVEMVADTEEAVDGTVAADADGTVSAEFVVGSFSIFTLTWSSYINNNQRLSISCVNESGTGIGSASSDNITDASAVSGIAPEITGYTFLKAVVSSSSNAATAVNDGTEISHLQATTSAGSLGNTTVTWQYSTDGNDYNNIGNQHVYFVYKLATVATVDSASNGITINLFDYTASTVNSVTNSLFYFFSGTSSRNEDWNRWVEATGNMAHQGIVQNTLDSDKIPILATKASGASLNYLFSTDTSISRADTNGIYAGLNNLFLLSTYKETGYYEYDSDYNFASIVDSENGEDFVVYANAYDISSYNSGAKFMPFNSPIGSSSLDYHFGMTISFDFIQPKDGIVDWEYEGATTSNEMEFEFSGDDDVWVYIDDVLVLDIGGIHGAVKGTINFATGVVKVYSVYSSGEAVETTLYDIMFAAHGQAYCDANFTQIGENQYIFNDYSTHSFNYFYLERGAGGSNCHIKFNIQSIDTGTISFGKSLEEYTNVAYAEDIDFVFNVYVDYDGENASTYDYAPYSGTYVLYNLSSSNVPISDELTTTNGVITLKDGQFAKLTSSSITEQSTYYITEVGATSDKYDVEVVGTSNEDVTKDTTANEATTTSLGVDEQSFIVFHNTVVADNQFVLRIDKKMSGNPDETYEMTVLIGGVAYNGSYDLYNEDGTLVEGTYSTDDGVVSLKPGQYILIRGLIGGSSVEVTETSTLDTNVYNDPVYAISGSLDNVKETSTVGKASGTALEGTELKESGGEICVVVTNSLKTTTITVEKLVAGNMGDTNKGFTFTLQVGNGTTFYTDTLTVQRSDTTGTSSLTSSDNKYTFNLSNGETIVITVPTGYTYTVTERDYASEGYKTTYKLSGSETECQASSGTVEAEGTITFTNTKYVSAPTGITRDVAPYGLALGLALGGAVLMFVSRRRRV